MAAQNVLNNPTESTIIETRPRKRLATQHAIVESNRPSTPGSSHDQPPPQSVKDPLIYPGLYSPSGIDIMSILVRSDPDLSIIGRLIPLVCFFLRDVDRCAVVEQHRTSSHKTTFNNTKCIQIRVYNRPNPTIHIGNVDSAVALVLSDAEQPDLPLVYCSEPFETLTGYTSADILGKNCRFLQYPPYGQAPQDNQVSEMNAAARKELREKIATGEEARVRLFNYRKDGSIFANLLTTIPIVWEGEGGTKNRYIVGFQADEGRAFF